MSLIETFAADVLRRLKRVSGWPAQNAPKAPGSNRGLGAEGAPGLGPASTNERSAPVPRTLGLAGVVVVASVAYLCGVLQPIDGALAQLRYQVVERPVSRTLTVVEIDVSSLRAAQTWPWSRARFAKAIDNLNAAGAEVVAFDVDFSARSSEGADGALEAAIARRPGSVVLPTFVQTVGRAGDRRLEGTNPLSSLSDEAILASVNVPMDADGEVRRYQYAFTEAAGERQTMGATLAGIAPGRQGSFLIDYGIRAADIDRISFEAAYSGRFDPALVRGRKVLIGATALELGDEFVTPKGTMPGVYVHALAYESLHAGRALADFQPFVVFTLAGLAAIFLQPRSRLDLSKMLRRHAAVAGGALLVPLAAQAALPVSFDTSPILVVQALCLFWTTRFELKRRAAAVVEAREAHLVELAVHMRKSRDRMRTANKKLQSSNAALDRALKAKTEFLAATSHEIRTPLNAILGMSQVILADPTLSSGIRDKVGAVQNAGETMQALVSDILDVAQMETGALVVTPVDMDLQKLLTEIAAHWSAAAATRGLTFHAEHGDLPGWIAQDPARLRQMVSNLLSNAVKFTAQGEIRLVARVSPAASGDLLVLEVSDSGLGIPADQMEQIFEPFHQVDGGLARRYEGTGLGLAICRQLAQAMGGDVTVRSELDVGSVFTARLPLKLAKNRRRNAVEHRAAAADSLETSAVLLLDSNPLFQRVIKAALVEHVASIETASSVVGAVETLQLRRFDLVLAEGLSLGSNVEAASKALGGLIAGAQGAKIGVIWGGPAEDAERLRAAGADYVACKPLNTAELVRQLRLVCSALPSDPHEAQKMTPAA